jgi:hypothetical protein
MEIREGKAYFSNIMQGVKNIERVSTCEGDEEEEEKK